MIDQKLIDYIRQHLTLGETKENILALLEHRLWSHEDIEENFNAAISGNMQAPVNNPPLVVQPLQLEALSQIVNVQQTTPQQTPTQATVLAISQTVSQTQVTLPSPSKVRGIVLVFAVLLIGVTVSFAGYGYVEKIGPFSTAPYDESNLLGGILASFNTIKTSTYIVTASAKVVGREPGRIPFVLSEDVALKEKYNRDLKRVTGIRFIIGQLQNYSFTSKGQYPLSLADIDTYVKDISKNTYSQYQLNDYLKNNYLKDPITNEYYEYSVNQDRTEFNLKAVFETSDVVNLIKQNTTRYTNYSHDSNQTTVPTTIIDKKTVTFTKGSSSYLYVSDELPKPFLVMLSEIASEAPAELNVSTSIKAATNIIEGKDPEWSFTLDALGGFGDLTYRIGADAVRKDSLYYFRINNIPGVFGVELSALKGKWIKIDSSSSTNNQYSYSDLSFLTSSIPEAEKKYKDNRADTQDFFKKVVGFADEEKVIILKNKPVKISVDGESVYKYEVSLKKENIVPFYKKMTEEAQSNKTISSSGTFSDSVTLEYLESKQFQEMFDYINDTVDVIVYITPKGLLQGADYVMHVTPADKTTALKDKQIDVMLSLRLQDINKQANILAPATSTTMEEIASEYRSRYYNNGYVQQNQVTTSSGDAKKIAELKAMQLALDQYAEANEGTYPTKLTALSPVYMPMLPSDPNYKYAALGKTVCSAYHLGIALESTSSLALANDADATPTVECTGSAKDFSGADPIFDVKGEQ